MKRARRTQPNQLQESNELNHIVTVKRSKEHDQRKIRVANACMVKKKRAVVESKLSVLFSVFPLKFISYLSTIFNFYLFI